MPIQIRRKADEGVGSPADGSLLYGEPAVDGAGNVYIGIPDGVGGLLTVKVASPEQLDITSFGSPSSGLRLVSTTPFGDISTPLSFTAAYNFPPSSVTFTAPAVEGGTGGSFDPVVDLSGTINAWNYVDATGYTLGSGDVGTSVTFQLTASHPINNDGPVSLSVTGANRIYSGNAAAGLGTTLTANTTDAVVAGILGAGTLQLGRNGSYTETAGGSDKLYLLFRTADITGITISIGGFDSTSAFTTSVHNLDNGSGVTESYTLYESINAGLGTTTMVVT